MTTKRILIAPAGFKGSLSAPCVASLIAASLNKALTAHTRVETETCPLADGGDDTLAVLEAVDAGFQAGIVTVTGPLISQHVTARYLIHPKNGLAVLEASQAHGLRLLPNGQSAPMDTTSYGVGELIRKVSRRHPALDTVVVTLGGSASTDGGLGALQALGLKLFDTRGAPLTQPVSGGSLAAIAKVQLPEEWHLPVRLVIATDVVSPLLGPDGTARVFAPQKGASPEQCEQLEAGLHRISEIMQAAFVPDYAPLPGTGAAGGLAYGLSHLPRAGIVSGTQWLAEYTGIQAKIGSADLIITGEGRFDATSYAGKATGQLLAWADDRPVALICGQMALDTPLPPHCRAFPLASMPSDAQAALQHPEAFLERAVAQALPWIREQLGLSDA